MPEEMKICQRCFKVFDENEAIDNDPIKELGDIFISEMEEVKDFCHECREELGLMNWIGFRP